MILALLPGDGNQHYFNDQREYFGFNVGELGEMLSLFAGEVNEVSFYHKRDGYEDKILKLKLNINKDGSKIFWVSYKKGKVQIKSFISAADKYILKALFEAVLPIIHNWK